MKSVIDFGFEMALISEVYWSTLSSIMTPQGLDRYFSPLLYLNENSGKLTQKDLAEAIRRDKVHTMRIVDYLCEKDLLLRQQDVNDKRCQILIVTEKGKALVPKINDAIVKTDELIFHNFSKEEKEILKTGIRKLYDTIITLPDPEYIVQAIKRNNNIDEKD